MGFPVGIWRELRLEGSSRNDDAAQSGHQQGKKGQVIVWISHVGAGEVQTFLEGGGPPGVAAACWPDYL
jgi:hypothetical protein